MMNAGLQQPLDHREVELPHGSPQGNVDEK